MEKNIKIIRQTFKITMTNVTGYSGNSEYHVLIEKLGEISAER